MAAAVWALLRFTRFGLATRASDENEKGAALLGYSPQLLAGVNWVLSAVLAGITGLVVVGLSSLSVDRFTLYVVPALGAALFGNLTSIPLAVGRRIPDRHVPVRDGRAGRQRMVARVAAGQRCPRVGAAARDRHRAVRQGVTAAGQRQHHPAPPAPRTRRPGTRGSVSSAGVVIALLLSNWFTAQWEVALTTSMVAGLIMLSSVVLVGFLGQISLAQTALAGIAAYTAIRFASEGVLGPFDLARRRWARIADPIAFLLGVAAAVVVGLLLGLPALRIRGVQLAIVTVAAVGPIGDLLLQNESIFSTAAQATMPVPGRTGSAPYVGATDPDTGPTDYWHFTAFAVVVFVLVGLAVANLRRGAAVAGSSPCGPTSERAAAAGINVASTKLLGFGIASALAGIGGILQAYRLGAVQAETYSLFAGLAILAFAYLGGITCRLGRDRSVA